MKALYAFLYIYFVWLMLPSVACPQTPTKGTMVTWIVSQSATILILNLVYRHKMKRWKSQNEDADSSDQSLSQESYSHADREGVIGYETDYSYELEPQVKKKSKSGLKSKPAEEPDLVLYVMYYLAISVIMLVVAVNVPDAARKFKYYRMLEQGQEEFREHIEAELPDIIKALNDEIRTVEVSVTDEPLEDYASEYDSQEEYVTTVNVYVTSYCEYFEPEQIQSIYQTICKNAQKIIKNSCPNRIKYEEELQKYEYNPYIKLKKLHDGVELKVETEGHIYKACSEQYNTGFEGILHEITDETRWLYVNLKDYSTQPNNMSTTWLSKDEVESKRTALREAALSLGNHKESSSTTTQRYGSGSSSYGSSSYGSSYSGSSYSGKSGSSSKYKETDLDAYDKGYDDVDIDGDYDEYRYEHDSDYASGVDDAMDELDEWY